MERHDPGRLRISDDDRHRVAEVLRHAAGEGRIDLEELEDRLEATYSAKTYSDLVPITADLPGHATHMTSPPVPRQPTSLAPAQRYSASIAVMSSCERKGVWLMPEQHTAFAMMGGVKLDLREAQFAARDVTIYACSIMGDVSVVVNKHTQVFVDGVPIMGDFRQSRDKVAPELSPNSQIVRVKGLALMASVSVQRKPMPGEPQTRLGWSR